MAIAYLTRGSSIISIAFLAACASSPTTSDWPYPEPPESGDWGYENREADDYSTPRNDSESGYYQPPYGSPTEPATRDDQAPTASTHPTVQALVNQAERERGDGQLDRAAATLERAIRIVNDDPLPWLKLAEIRFEQSNFIQAENLARRSISFANAGGSSQRAWLLIADIKRLQGDDAAARDAEAQAYQR
ncbi:MAG: hypothetical protein ACSHXK_07995 [Oceanococcus sp.]